MDDGKSKQSKQTNHKKNPPPHSIPITHITILLSWLFELLFPLKSHTPNSSYLIASRSQTLKIWFSLVLFGIVGFCYSFWFGWHPKEEKTATKQQQKEWKKLVISIIPHKPLSYSCSQFLSFSYIVQYLAIERRKENEHKSHDMTMAFNSIWFLCVFFVTTISNINVRTNGQDLYTTHPRHP